MWPCELMQEFGVWICTHTIFNNVEKNAQYCKFRYNGFMTLMSLMLLFFISSHTTDIVFLIHESLKYALISDIIMLLIRWFFISRYRKAYHIILFVHMFVHFVLIVNVGAVIKNYFIDVKSDESKSEIESFLFVYIFVVLRIVYYLILFVMCIFLSPCLIYSILKKRRNRLRLHEFIREERIRNGGSFALLNRYNQNEVNNRQHEDQVILLEESKEFQPIQNEFEFPRNSFNEILLNLLRGHQLIERNEGTFEGLKRIKYEEALKKLDYEECTICMDSFKTETDEDLIYLPCNTKHIFHSTCILEWLRRDPNCPLCKSPVNKDAINMYG